MEGPSPGLVRTRAASAAPSAKHNRNLRIPPPASHPGSQHLPGPGWFSHSPTPHQPAAPTVPRHPTSRTEPASPTPACPMAQRSPHLFRGQGGIPTPAFPGGHRQTPPDQHPPPPALPPGFPLETSSLGFREVCETHRCISKIPCGPPLTSLRVASHGTNSREEAPSGTRGWEAELTAGGL